MAEISRAPLSIAPARLGAVVNESAFSFENVAEIARLGRQIYSSRYQEKFERDHMGAYAIIEIETGAPYIADTPFAAIREARCACPQGVFHLVKIGQPGAFPDPGAAALRHQS